MSNVRLTGYEYPDDWHHTTGDVFAQPDDILYDINDNRVCEVKITWIDAKSYGGGWLDMEQVKQLEPGKAATKGFIVHEDNYCYFIAQTVGDDGAYNIFVIPKGCVTRIDRES